jgi:hypothetical protein
LIILTPPLEEFGEMRGIKMRSTTTARSCFARDSRDAKQMRQGTTKNDTWIICQKTQQTLKMKYYSLEVDNKRRPFKEESL